MIYFIFNGILLKNALKRRKTVKSELELNIRKGYSKDLKCFKSLKTFVANTFEELCFQDKLIFDHSERIKDINSLLDKIDKKNNNGLKINDFQQALENIKDIVAARLIVLEPQRILTIHNIIINIERFAIQQIKILVPSDMSGSSLIKDILESKNKLSVDIQIRENETGYFGVHYIIEPRPIDPFYVNCEVPLHTVFELQLRTLMMHTWSEIQHRAIYKNTDNEKENLGGLFEVLAHQINGVDKMLSKLAYENNSFLPTMDFNIQVSNDYTLLLDEIKIHIRNFEENNLHMKYRYKLIKEEFLEKHKQIITEFLSSETPDTLTANLFVEIAELLLKSGRYKESVVIYKKCLEYSDLKHWVLLRICEALIQIEETKKAIFYYNKIKNYLLKNLDFEARIAVLSGAAVIAWKLDDNNQALIFSTESISNIKELPIKQQITNLSNYLYFVIETIEENYFEDKSKEKACSLFDAESENVEYLQKLEKEHSKIFSPDRFDTLAWYFFKRFEICDEGSCEKNTFLILASEYMEKCYVCHQEKNPNGSPRELWSNHKYRIYLAQKDCDK